MCFFGGKLLSTIEIDYKSGGSSFHHRERRGGAIWLATLIALAGLWISESSIWLKGIAGWIVVAIAWAVVLRLRGELSAREASLSLIGSALCWLAAAGAGVACLFAIANNNPYTSIFSNPEIPWFVFFIINCVAIVAVLALLVWLWLLSAVVPAVAGRAGGNPLRMVALAASETRKNVRLWFMLPLTACIHLISLSAAANCGETVQVIAGLANGWTELLLLAGMMRFSKLSPPSAQRHRTDSTVVQGRRTALLAIGALHLLLFGFYGALFLSGGHPAWKIGLTYPLSIASGAVIAAIAWLLGLFKPLYYAALAVIFVLVSILFVLIISQQI